MTAAVVIVSSKNLRTTSFAIAIRSRHFYDSIVEYESLTSNLSPTIRRVTRDGRQYLVADATLIVPGVLNGSRGRLYYPPDEVAKNPQQWDRTPMVVYHPQVDGVHVSAKTPGIIEKYGIGFLERNRYEDKHKSELWFDEVHTVNYDKKLRPEHQIMPRLIAGKPISLSTGLYTDNEPRSGKTDDGREYDAIARNYKPDHLAILPDQQGACSIQDGCGVNVNAEAGPTYRDLVERVITGNAHLDDLLECEADCDDDEDCIDDCLANNTGTYGNVQSTSTGRFKPFGAGYGKGEVHESAQRGNMVFSERDRELGASARAEKEATGQNPASWVEDEATWEKAKTAADKGYDEGDEAYWAVVAHIYQKMGGTVKQTNNANPEGCNQYKSCGGGGEQPEKTEFQKTAEGSKVKKFGKYKSKHGDVTVEHDEDTGTLILKGPKHSIHITDNQFGDTTMTRDQIINQLTTNCDCWKGAKDVLNSMTDERLKKLLTAHERDSKNVAVVNALAKPLAFTVGKERKELVFNAETNSFVVNACDANGMEPVSADDEEESVDAEGNPVPKKKKAPPPMMNQQSRLTPQEQEDLRTARRITENAKRAVIRQLVANVTDTTKQARLVANLQKKSLEELEDLLELRGPQQTTNQQPEEDVNWFFGAAGGQVRNRAVNDDDVAALNQDAEDMMPATLNYEEMVAENRRAAV